MSSALARRPEAIRAEISANPERREQLRAATDEVLRGIEAFVSRYVVLPDEASSVAMALYVLHTWTTGACDATPYLIIVSAEKGSGKTRALEVLGLLVRKPWHTSSTTETALFRRMDQDHPTLMLDELDTVFRGGVRYEGLRAVLNAGNRRGSTVTRCDGNYGTREYETFGPKVMAGIDTGFIPETVLDRSIVIRMRKRTSEQVQRLRLRVAQAEVSTLARTIEVWALLAEDELAQATPELPEDLGDRAADAYEPLLAIADFAGASWPSRAREAASKLNGRMLEPGTAQESIPSASLMPGLLSLVGA